MSTTPRKRQVVRELRVDLDAVARAVLMEQHWPEEELLEVYRYIATTASQSGRRWASRDAARWNRFRGLDRELGRHGWRPSDFPKEGGFGLGFTFSSRDYADKLRDVIMRIAWGSTPQASRWRRIFKSRALVVPCKVCRRVAGRQYAAIGFRHPQEAPAVGAMGLLAQIAAGRGGTIMPRAVAARPTGVSLDAPLPVSRFTTMSASCTRMPTPMPRPT